jgi:hypothetical protein
MNPTRLLLLAAAGGALLLGQPLRAQAPAAAPYTPDKQFSTDQIIALKDGTTMLSHMYADNGKMRVEMNTHGMDIVSIVRPDEKKVYSVMTAQKMVMVMTLDPDKAKQYAAMASGDDSKFELMGSDVIDGTPCLKYKMTAVKENKIFFWWVSVAGKAPVKIAAEDGSSTLMWRNYKPGPQDPALFEPPAGYTTMAMPGGAPGGP